QQAGGEGEGKTFEAGFYRHRDATFFRVDEERARVSKQGAKPFLCRCIHSLPFKNRSLLESIR
ncbi:MAG: hypothetical protein ACRC52_00905, partial [Aeromonas veronii]